MPGLKQRAMELYGWFEQRLGLGQPIIEMAEHEVPENTSSWWYVFGSAATVLLVLQVMTGILLALVYTPSAGHAWNSLQFLDHNVKLGWFLRAVHGWGSDFMIAIVLIHMAQVFTFGAYKFPRELTWIIGVFLLLLTLSMAFTGQVLRFDQDAYWGLGIGASIVSRVPIIGGWLVDMMLGGPIIAGPTLTRFFALHVFVIPGTLLGMVGLHLWMVLRLGINDWPMPGRVVRKSTYVITNSPNRPVLPSYRMLRGRTRSLRLRSCCRSSRVLLSSVRLVPRGSQIRRLFKRRRNRTSHFFGSTLFSPTFHQAWRPRFCSSHLFSVSVRCCFFLWLQVRERSTGRVARLRCLCLPSLLSRLVSSRGLARIRRGARLWMRGRVM
jgi:Cytochrome b/b6/petB